MLSKFFILIDVIGIPILVIGITKIVIIQEGLVEAGAMIKNYKPDYFVPLMLKKLKDKYPTADGLILSEENNWKGKL